MSGLLPSGSAEFLRSLAEETPDGVVVLGPDGDVVFVNRRFLDMWGLVHDRPERISVGTVEAVLQRVVSPAAATWTVGAEDLSQGVPVQDELVLDDGRVLDRVGAALRNKAGAFMGWAWYCREVTRLHQAEAEQRALASTLQSSLLPPIPPAVPGMDLATRYLPADASVGGGGDFYDVFRVGANDWGLVVGDVCGKGARAAALTALTRYTLRAATFHHFLPSAVLDEVNGAIVADSMPDSDFGPSPDPDSRPHPDFVSDSDDRFCTLVLARLQLDTCGAWVTLSAAGHPRPVVVRRAGWLDVRGQIARPLGLFPDALVSDDRVGLGPGDTLVVCTDGVTEARDASGELFGDEKLFDTMLDVAGKPAETVVQRIVEDARAFAAHGSFDDDVAVLVVRVPEEAKDDPMGRVSAAIGLPSDQLSLPRYRVGEPPDDLWQQRPAPPREARIQLMPDATSARATRRFLAGLLRSWRMPELVDGDIELLASELVTNVIRHVESPFTVIVRYDGRRLRVEVGDGSRALPATRSARLDDETGRGLLLIGTLASAWGVTPTLVGKRVWFEVPDYDRPG